MYAKRQQGCSDEKAKVLEERETCGVDVNIYLRLHPPQYPIAKSYVPGYAQQPNPRNGVPHTTAVDSLRRPFLYIVADFGSTIHCLMSPPDQRLSMFTLHSVLQ